MTVLSTREEALANRELGLSARERATGEYERALADREEIVRLRETALRVHDEAERAWGAHEHLLGQLRDANEQLVLATLRAEASAEAALAARAIATESARVEADGRHRAETLAAELQKSEEALRVSEHQLRTQANTVPMLAWYANPDGSIAWYNQRWYEYTGGAFDEHLGWRWQALIDPEDLPRIVTGWRAATTTGEPWEDVFRLRRHDGELRWFLGRALPLRDATGRIERWFGVTVDINDRKRAEAQAQANSRAKDEFLAMLGHELRNPLAPIMAALDLIAMIDPTAFARERAIIQRQLGHLVRMVDDLLDVSRIAGGKIELVRAPVELADIVLRAIELASPLIEKKAHHLSVVVPPHGLVIDGDAIRLAQAVGNVLTNAAKYTPPGGSIVVTGERRGPSVVLRVRDTGIGISAEMLPKIFELFAQERQALDRPEGGLGLGLAIVRSLVAMHGGTVTARSEGLGHGSELEIELPAALPEIATADILILQPTSMGGRKVLVVDDNRETAELIALSLARLGHDVRFAHDGPSALAIVGTFVPDVALLDIGLPVMDGYELARQLRAAVVPHDVRLVALTGYGSAADLGRSRAAGFAMHLVKPAGIAALQAVILDIASPLAGGGANPPSRRNARLA